MTEETAVPAFADATRRDVTVLLHAWGNGDAGAAERLTEIVYAQVRAMASKHLRKVAFGSTLQATELAHEMFVNLLEANVQWRDRRHFYGVVSAALRNILIDAARARGSEKRGGDQIHVTLSAADSLGAELNDAVTLHEALEALRAIDVRKHEIVEYFYLLGLKRDEIAEVTDLSVPTVDRELRFARAWLKEHLR
ncbi:MAG: ECF-type sigma factor [Dokdonella sp.]